MRLLWYVSRRSQPSTASPEVGMAFLISKWARMPMTSQVNGTKNGCIMKNFNKIFFAAVAAAFGLASCSQELTPVEKPQDNLVTVNFGAEASITCPTKATLTTEDEKLFTSAWENGDVLSVEYISPETADNKIITATWNGTSFVAKGLPNETGAWDYTACYPKPDENDNHIDFGANRTQKGNAYNSIYDVMIGNKSTKNSAAGKDDDGSDIVFNMKRQTAVTYFHLTGGPAEEQLVSATLSVEGGFIASQHAYISNFAFAPSQDLNEITITFDEGTAPKASDFQLWFNVLPTNYTKMTLTVETTAHKLTLNNKTAGEFKAENLYKTVLTPEAGKWIPKSTPEFTDFSRFTGPIEEGYYLVVYQNKAMKALINKDRLQYDAVNASNGIITKPGTGIIWQIKKYGEYWTLYNPETKTYAASTGAASKAALLNSVEDKALWTITKDKEDNYEFVNKANKAAQVNCNLRNNGTYGFACYATQTGGALSLYKLSDPSIPTLSIDQTSKTWASDATDAFVVNVTVNSEGGDWTVTPETLSWATIAVDKTAGTITVTPNGANETETANEATLAVTHTSDASLKKEITLKQNAAGGATTPVVLYTLTPTNGTNNSYAGNCDVTVNGIVWNLTGNSQINPWKFGGKKITKVDRALYSKTAYPKALTGIKITFGASNITINSCKLVYSTNADFTDSKECNINFKASSTVEVTENFPANAYYKLVFNVTNTTNSNKGVELSKIEFIGLQN